jgi:Family of unknown function (DUF6401)
MVHIVGYCAYMTEPSVQLSAAALRLAGHVGQTALDRIAEGELAAAAELDQHVAAVRAELAICQQPPGTRGPHTNRRTAAGILRRCLGLGRAGRVSRSWLRGPTHDASELRARLATLRNTTVTCPNVPFVGDALQSEAPVPVTLLMHYASGFVDAGLDDGWWPGQSADATDWVSLRLAAICKLISQAEAAADAHPDLRASA